MKQERIIESANEDRGYKLCKCSICDVVARCTPSFDFYSTPETGDKLLCENCFREHTVKQLQDKRMEKNL